KPEIASHELRDHKYGGRNLVLAEHRVSDFQKVPVSVIHGEDHGARGRLLTRHQHPQELIQADGTEALADVTQMGFQVLRTDVRRLGAEAVIHDHPWIGGGPATSQWT